MLFPSPLTNLLLGYRIPNMVETRRSEALKFVVPRVAKYQPNEVVDPEGYRATHKEDDPKTAVYLADIPVGEEAYIFADRGKQHLTGEIREVKDTPQRGNPVVTVRMDSEFRGFYDVKLGAGTAAIRASHRVPVEFRRARPAY